MSRLEPSGNPDYKGKNLLAVIAAAWVGDFMYGRYAHRTKKRESSPSMKLMQPESVIWPRRSTTIVGHRKPESLFGVVHSHYRLSGGVPSGSQYHQQKKRQILRDIRVFRSALTLALIGVAPR